MFVVPRGRSGLECLFRSDPLGIILAHSNTSVRQRWTCIVYADLAVLYIIYLHPNGSEFTLNSIVFDNRPIDNDLNPRILVHLHAECTREELKCRSVEM